ASTGSITPDASTLTTMSRVETGAVSTAATVGVFRPHAPATIASARLPPARLAVSASFTTISSVHTLYLVNDRGVSVGDVMSTALLFLNSRRTRSRREITPGGPSMRHVRRWTTILTLSITVGSASAAQTSPPDWAALARYRGDNAALGAPRSGEQRVVFMGNSITEGWAPRFDSLFPGKPYVGRGISGQTTPQMLVRLRQDVIARKPNVLVILGGTNDIAGNTGPSTLEMIEDNLASMTELAKANGIRVVLVSVLPAADYPWRRGLEPGPKIVALNAWIR